MSSAEVLRPAPSGDAKSLLRAVALAAPAAAVLALVFQGLYQSLASRPDQVVMAVGAVCVLVLAVVCGTCLAARRRTARLSDPGLPALATIFVCLAAIYLFWVAGYVVYPADFLIWSESDFVNDILKFRIGYPLYSDRANHESFTYMPGAQLLTYALASLAGLKDSVAAWRAVQILYAALAAWFASLAAAGLLRIATGRCAGTRWHLFWFPALFLAATNSLTNAYIHNLHNDSLTQLVSAAAFYTLVRHAETPGRGTLAAMILLPAAGLVTKQSTAIWALFFAAYMAVFARERSWKRAFAYAGASFGLLLGILAACCALWGEPFVYWVIEVLGKHGVVPLRSLQHGLAVWPYFAAGIGGGLVLLRGPAFSKLLGPWLIWLCLTALETYTSGVAWMINHIGPGSLLAVVWLCAALPVIWTPNGERRWFGTGARVALCLLAASGLGFVRIPLPALGGDAWRYARQIEREFQGLPPAAVLLDAGTWIYLPHGVVMKDRAPAIGEQGYSSSGDFSGVLARLNGRVYDKILLRNYHSADFWYDHGSWRRASGIRQALATNYHEVGRIRAVTPPVWAPEQAGNYLFAEISILAPNRPRVEKGALPNAG